MINAARFIWGSLDRIIMCMSHNERMLNGPGGLDFGRVRGDLIFRCGARPGGVGSRCRIIADDRNSDDFNLQYENNHADFIKWNLYSTVLTRHLSLVPDFDMFSSAPDSRWPTCHALLRALSPGPTFLSDLPGSPTDSAILARLEATDRSGESKVVKMDIPAAIPSVRWFWDNIQGEGEGPGLVAVAPAPGSQGALIAIWNVRDAGNGGLVRDRIGMDELVDAAGKELTSEHILWRVGMDSQPTWGLVTPVWGGIEVQVEKESCELFVLAPVSEVGGIKVAVLGMLDKYAPLAGMRVTQDTGECLCAWRLVESDILINRRLDN